MDFLLWSAEVVAELRAAVEWGCSDAPRNDWQGSMNILVDGLRF